MTIRYETVGPATDPEHAARIRDGAHTLWTLVLAYSEGFARRALIDEGIPLSRLSWIGDAWWPGRTLCDGDEPLARVWVDAQDYVLTVRAEWLA